MNWYKFQKISAYVRDMNRFPYSFQEDKSRSDYENNDDAEYVDIDYEKYITTLHELELKTYYVSRLQDYVQILPERKNNIIERFRQIGWRYFVPCRFEILRTFKNWKSLHQIHDPQAWSESIFNFYFNTMDNEEEVIRYLLTESDGIQVGDPNYGIKISADDIISSVPVEKIKKHIQDNFLYDPEYFEEDIKSFLNSKYEDDEDSEWDEFSVDSASDFLFDMDLQDEFLEYYLNNFDDNYIKDNQFYDLVKEEDVIETIKNRLYRDYMIYFGSDIEDVIDNISEAENRLNSVTEKDGISAMTMAVSLALNVLHVSGNIMRDYGRISQEYLDFLDYGTDSLAQDWEDEVRDEFVLGLDKIDQKNNQISKDEQNVLK